MVSETGKPEKPSKNRKQKLHLTDEPQPLPTSNASLYITQGMPGLCSYRSSTGRMSMHGIKASRPLCIRRRHTRHGWTRKPLYAFWSSMGPVSTHTIRTIRHLYTDYHLVGISMQIPCACYLKWCRCGRRRRYQFDSVFRLRLQKDNIVLCLLVSPLNRYRSRDSLPWHVVG